MHKETLLHSNIQTHISQYLNKKKIGEMLVRMYAYNAGIGETITNINNNQLKDLVPS